MSLITPPPPPPPPPVKTPGEIAGEALMEMLQKFADDVVAGYGKLMTFVWKSHLTPDVILAHAGPGGTKAGAMFQFGSQIAATIAAAYPSAVLPEADYANWNIAFNPDGTVTLTPIPPADPGAGSSNSSS